MKNTRNLETAIAGLKTLDRVRDMKEDAIATEILRLYPRFRVSEKWKRHTSHA
jgi:hypothetical protein